MITAGIDIGSISSKAAILSDGKILGTRVNFTGDNSERAEKNVYDEFLTDLGIEPSSVDAIVSTGYGRNSVTFATESITEIGCHGAGAFFLKPDVKFVIDIGGQDSKALSLDDNGRVHDFAVNVISHLQAFL